MYRIIRPLLALAFVVATVGVSSVTQQARAADEPPYATPVKTIGEALSSGRISRETYDALRARGSAPIIARLRLPTPFRAEGSIPSLVDQQRQSIANVQQRVTQQLAGHRIDNVKRFSTIPHIAMEVDSAALTALVAMPEIEIVLAETPMAPQLGNSVPLVGADNVHNFYGVANTGAGQAVAIVDSGVQANHPFFGGRIVSQACYSTESSITDSVCPGGVEETVDPNSGGPCTGVTNCNHGTLVAGIAAGNGTGVMGAPPAGVAPGADIISIQVFSKFTDNAICMAAVQTNAPCLLANPSDVVKGLERVYERRNSHTIAAANLSLGSGRYTQQSTCDLANWFYRDVVQNLKSVGIYTVAASGNGAQTSGGFRPGLAAPACVTDVVSVGATTGATPVGEQVWAGSQTMGFLTLLAPGANVTTSTTGSGYAPTGGTSMAAPHVAGALAVLRSLFAEPVGGFVPVLTRTGTPITDIRANMNMVKPRLQLDAAVEDQLGYPIPPTRFRKAAAGGTTMALLFDDNSFGETRFVVDYRDTSRPGWTNGSNPGRNAQNATVSGLTPATDYEFRLAACNGNVCSPWVFTTATTLDTRPCTPSNFRVSNRTFNSLSVAWDYACSNQNPVWNFKIRTNATANQSQISPTYASNTRSATFTNLDPGTGHYFYISACNQFCSNESPMLWGVTLSPTAPAAPTNLHWCGEVPFELCSAGGPQLLWNDNANNESEYRLYYTSAPPGAIPVPATSANGTLVTLPANRSSHQPTLQSGWTYSFVVYAYNSAGFSTMSNRETITAP